MTASVDTATGVSPPTLRAQRREAVQAHATLAGLDFAEVTVALELLEAELSLYFIPPAAGVAKPAVPAQLGAEHIRVAAARGDGRALAVLSLDTSPHGEHIRVARIALGAEPDLDATYAVTVATPPGDETAIDPFFAEATFRLDPGRPRALDCAAVRPAPGEPGVAPEIDHLARDYAGFRALMLDRLALVAPEWKLDNPADSMLAVVEALAAAADGLSYFQDAVATEAYLSTARRRVSVRRHARLLDYAMHEGTSARVWVQLTVAPPGPGDPPDLLLPRGTQLLTTVSGRASGQVSADDIAIAPGSDAYAQALIAAPEIFETLHEAVLDPALDQLSFHTWGARALSLPAGATAATLVQPAAGALPLRAGDVVIFEERLGPDTGLAADADPLRRHAVRLTSVTPATDPLGTAPGGEPGLPVVDIAWHGRDALPFAMCVSAVVDGRTVSDITIARGNVVLAEHGRTIAGEAPEPAEVPAPDPVHDAHRPRPYRPRLVRAGVVHRVPYDHAAAQLAPAADAMVQDPRRATPDISLGASAPEFDSGGGGAATEEDWMPRGDLLASDRFDRAFVVEVETDGEARLRFGDGTSGRAPAPGTRFLARYRVGGGPSGNIGSDALAHVVTDDAAIVRRLTRVRNPLPAAGGLAPEPIDQVALHAPHAFRITERCVTAADHVAIAVRHPEVTRAAAVRRWAGSWAVVVVAVDRAAGASGAAPPVDDAFRREVRAFLEPFRLLGADLEIRGPRYVPLEIALHVRVRPDHLRTTVRQGLIETFSDVDLPDGRRGFFHPANFGFGDAVVLSRVVTAARAVAGIEWVAATRFARLVDAGPARAGSAIDSVIDVGPLDIARVASDPDDPGRGSIDFTLEGGL